MKYVKPEKIWVRDNAEMDEKWIQDKIADDPAILGLGDVILKDRERVQPKAGRLDLLLQDLDAIGTKLLSMSNLSSVHPGLPEPGLALCAQPRWLRRSPAAYPRAIPHP